MTFTGATTQIRTVSSNVPNAVIPNTAAVGDVAVALLFVNSGTTTITGVPSGWTFVTNKVNGNNGAQVFVYWRQVVPGDPNSSHVWNLDVGVRSVFICRTYSNLELSNPIDVAPVGASGNTAAPTVGSVSTTLGNAMDLAIYGFSAAAATTPPVPTWTAPAGYANGGAGQTAGTSGGANIYASIWDKQVASGPTGSLVAGLDVARQWLGVNLALRPRTTDTPPVVDAGVDQTMAGSSLVTLSATGYDPDGGSVIFSWGQVSGPVVVNLSGGESGLGAVQTFIAPNITGDYVFQANAAKPNGASSTDTMTVHVTSRVYVAAFRTSSTYNGSSAGSNASIIVPGTTQYGDLALFFVLVNSGPTVVTAPAGYVLLGSQISSNNGSALWVFSKVVNSTSEAGHAVRFDFDSSCRCWITCRIYDAINPTTPLDLAAVFATGNNANPNALSLTPASDLDMGVVFYGGNLPSTPLITLGWTPPVGYNNPVTGQTNATTGGTNVYEWSGDHPHGPDAGTPTGNITATVTDILRWISCHILLKQKSGNTPPVPNAGPDVAQAFPFVTQSLTGSAVDADGDAVVLDWKQQAGTPTVAVTPDNTPVAEFLAPPTREGTDLTFRLVADDLQITTHDDMVVHVVPHNEWDAKSGDRPVVFER